MSLFERYAMVEWSASNSPVSGKDSIWIGCAQRDGDTITLLESVNPRTRDEAMHILEGLIRASIEEGKRLLIGFDFPFGYPRGAAAAIGGKADWQALWSAIAAMVRDRPDNASNRFEVGGKLNREALADAPMFWGRPPHLVIAGLSDKKPEPYPSALPERRLCEERLPRAQPVWKLAFAGSVGSQSLLGFSRLEALRRDETLSGKIKVWPFETGFADDLSAPCVIAEIYPALFPVMLGDRTCLDQAQVETLAEGFATADAEGTLGTFLAGPEDLTPDERETVLTEEGWILGLGGPQTPSPELPMPAVARLPGLDYLRDPAAIYAASFAAIQAEADFSGVAKEARDLAIRLIHACGMTDLTADLVVSPGAVAAGRRALQHGAKILCDAEMVAHGIIRRTLPAASEIICRLNDPSVAPLAERQRTTRSAAQVDLWDGDLRGAVVAIGNAPTALFRLLERIDAGAPKPALIIGMPVGFVGAAESKAELVRDSRGIPFITVTGRRGGSALAAAAVNAVAAGLGTGS
jgi:precorrin-8X/cobalt-precorrin-8 methylmutase